MDVVAAIRALLAGDPLDESNLSVCGAWAEVVEALVDAHQAGGTAAVRQVFGVLVKATPGLADLVAGDTRLPKTTWTVADLLATEFLEPKWAVPGILPVGLCCLAGRPKVGKSYLALQIAVAVGTGGMMFDERVEPGNVLYLALEDSPRRLKTRLIEQGAPETTNIRFETRWATLPEGLIDLQAAIQTNNFALVVIDTLSRLLGGLDQQDVSKITPIFDRLQHITTDYDLTMLGLDHHRKPFGREGDPIDDLLGTTGKAAVVDAALGLYREPGRRGTILKVVGRDLEERELALQRDALTRCWQLLGEADEVRQDTFKGDIVGAIQELEELGELPTTTNIAKHIKQNKGNVSHAIADLLALGKVAKGTKQGAQQPYRTP